MDADTSTRERPVTLADIYHERRGTNSDIVDHLPYLHDTVIERGAQVIVELGVRSGMSTAAFLAAAEANGGHVWSVDIVWPHVPTEFVDSDHWTLLVGNDLELAPELPDAIDVLFIDTSHEYQQTLDELATFVPKVKPGGVVLLHDTELANPDGVDGPLYPVATALDEWAQATGIGWTNRPGCYGLGVIEVPHGG